MFRGSIQNEDPLYFRATVKSAVYVVSCMYFKMVPAVIKFLDDHQSRELRRI